MTVESFLHSATQKLVQAGVETARLDVLVLLEDILDTDRAQLLAHPETELTDEQVQMLDALIARRAEHEPLAYLRGKVEFYGREFIVSPDVLVPRPESETMIELLKHYAPALTRHPEFISGPPPKRSHEGSDESRNSPDSSLRWNDAGVRADFEAAKGSPAQTDFDKLPFDSETSENNQLTSKVFSGLKIGDVGTGSGALGITAALELPGSQVELLEIDSAALLVAQQNVAKYSLDLPVLQSDLLSGSTTDFDVLLCNLPYVPDDYAINQAALSEPALAIFGGSDGLDLFRKLFEQISARSTKPSLILTESLPSQHADLAIIALAFGYEQIVEDDFIQAFTTRNA